jgi:hypothetical protein
MSSWRIAPDEHNRIKSAEADLRKKLALKNEHANLLAERDQLEKEYGHFKEYASAEYPDKYVPVFSKAIPAARILDYIAEHELILSSNRTVSIFRKFVWRFRYGFTNFRFHRHPVEIIFTYCQELYYERRLKEISDRITEIESELQAYNFDYKMREYTELSMMAFKAKLASLYDGHSRKHYDKDDLWKHSGEFIKDYPVILSTTYSLSASLAAQFIYDYVIVDTPPVVAGPDSIIVGRNCDGIVIVIKSHSTKRKHLVRAKQELERNGVKILGSVLNGVKESDMSSFYYQYYKD